MQTNRKHYVTFVSPGTFFSETTTKPIEEWNCATACYMAKSITERYGAKPYCFYFSTSIVSNDIPDGEGGKLKVEPKQVAKSGNYFLGGKLRTREEVLADNKPDEEILRSNMEYNNMIAVVENCNSYKSVLEFTSKDAIVDKETGKIIVSGNDYK